MFFFKGCLSCEICTLWWVQGSAIPIKLTCPCPKSGVRRCRCRFSSVALCPFTHFPKKPHSPYCPRQVVPRWMKLTA